MTKEQIEYRITCIDRISKSIFFKDILLKLESEKKELIKKLEDLKGGISENIL